MDITLKQLEVFCKIVETGSFSKAAEEVCLTQSSVSERIANLEEALGTRLFDRFGKRVFLTDSGRFFYIRAKKLLDEKERMLLEMQDFLGLKKGDLKIGGSTIPGEYIIPYIIKKFRDTYPLVNTTLIVNDSQKIQDMVLEGGLHLGIVGFLREKDPNLSSIKVWKDELVIAVSCSHKWANKEEIELEELLKEPFILREKGSGTLRVMADYLRKYIRFPDDLNVVARLGSSTAIKEAVKAGVGISVISVRAIKTELKAGLISALRIKGIKMIRYFYLIWDNRRAQSPVAKAFIKFIEGEKDEGL